MKTNGRYRPAATTSAECIEKWIGHVFLMIFFVFSTCAAPACTTSRNLSVLRAFRTQQRCPWEYRCYRALPQQRSNLPRQQRLRGLRRSKRPRGLPQATVRYLGSQRMRIRTTIPKASLEGAVLAPMFHPVLRVVMPNRMFIGVSILPHDGKSFHVFRRAEALPELPQLRCARRKSPLPALCSDIPVSYTCFRLIRSMRNTKYPHRQCRAGHPTSTGFDRE